MILDIHKGSGGSSSGLKEGQRQTDGLASEREVATGLLGSLL